MVQDLAWQKRFLNPYIEKQDTFIPKGVMSRSYYERKEEKTSLSPARFQKKWKKVLEDKSVKMVVVKDHFKASFLDEMEKMLSDAGLKINLARVGGSKFFKTLQTKDYDIISGAYIGNFPDPDGFLEPINPKGIGKLGTYNTDKVLRDLEKVRYSLDAEGRIASYEKILRDYESQWSFVPLYRLNFPIIHHKKLKIPDASYRYEAELWNVFWN